MAKLNQGKIFLKVKTTLGDDNVLLSEFSATERISDVFECTAMLVTDRTDLNLSDMIGNPITVIMEFESEEKPEDYAGDRNPIAGKASSFLSNVKNAFGAKAKTNPLKIKMSNQYPSSLSFGIMDSIKGAMAGISKALGSGLSDKLKGGQAGQLGKEIKSIAANAMKVLGVGEAQDVAPAGFSSDMSAKNTSRLGGDAEKGLPGGILGKLGSGLSGLLGGGQTGKQATGVASKPGAGEGAGNGSGGGGITATIIKGLSSRFGDPSNAEPLGSLLSGLSGKLIDKARGNQFLNGLMDKFGGSEALKEKAQKAIAGLDTGALTEKLTVLIEGDGKDNKGLIGVVKDKIFGLLGKKKTPPASIGNIVAKGPKERRPAFGGTAFPQEGLEQRELYKKIRYFNGIVGEITQGATDPESHLTIYTAKFYPKLWILKHSKNCRIFQKMTAMEIISTILKENNITDVVDKTQKKGQIVREYCVQYNESNFDFISRLMEFEGIFYYFLHTETSHIMVLADAAEAHHQCPHTRQASLQTKPNGQSDFNEIQLADLVSRVVPGQHALTDYDFELPGNNLFSKIAGKGYGGRIYEYPGSYNNKTDGAEFVRTRIEEQELPKDMLYGISTIPYFEPGAYFNLAHHVRADANKKYVIQQVDHYAAQDAEDDDYYSNKFSAFDFAAGPFRPQQKTPSPRIPGTQTARVTGKKNEEIWTDEYGRVKVKFHWDENSANDENTSCWVRVSQGWAGGGWGMLFTPRIGHEVVVTFLDGDPDQPLITGSVFNGEKKPSYLPDAPTVSGIRTKSSKESEGFNELRFQDLADEEEIYIHAEKDMNTEILNDRNQVIHRGNDTTVIKTGSRTVTLIGDDAPKTSRVASEEIKGTGNDTLIIEKGSRVEHLKALGEAKADYTTTLNRGDRNVVLKHGDENLTLSKGSRNIKVEDGNEVRELSGDYTHTIGKNYNLVVEGDLDIKVDGNITINGKNISFTTPLKQDEVDKVQKAKEEKDKKAEKARKKKKEDEKKEKDEGKKQSKADQALIFKDKLVDLVKKDSKVKRGPSPAKPAGVKVKKGTGLSSSLGSALGGLSKLSGQSDGKSDKKSGGLGSMLSGLSKLGSSSDKKSKDGKTDKKSGGLAGMLSGLNKLGSSSDKKSKDGKADKKPGGLGGMLGGLSKLGGASGDKKSSGKSSGGAASLMGGLSKLASSSGGKSGAKDGASGGYAEKLAAAAKKIFSMFGNKKTKKAGAGGKAKKAPAFAGKKSGASDKSGKDKGMLGMLGGGKLGQNAEKAQKLAKTAMKVFNMFGGKKKKGVKLGAGGKAKKAPAFGGKKEGKKGGSYLGMLKKGLAALKGEESEEEEEEEKTENKKSDGPFGEIKFSSKMFEVVAVDSATLAAKNISADAGVGMKTNGGTTNEMVAGLNANISGGMLAKVTAAIVKIN